MGAMTRRQGMAARLRAARGLSLVELLIVLGIIGLISAVIVPFAINSGWFTSSKSAFAAREYFTLAKAASVYASTYNVETALAYGGRFVDDSETGERVPIVDSLVLSRRLKREEIIALRENGHSSVLMDVDGDYYAVVAGPEGVFRPLPNGTCLLPDLFRVDTVNPPYVSSTGLVGVRLYDVDEQRFLDPLYSAGVALHYILGTPAYVLGDPLQPAYFPAHRFKPDGSLHPASGFPRQRVRVRVGIKPDQPYSDRFWTNEDFALVQQPVPIVFQAFDTDGVTALTTDTFYSDPGDDPPNTLADIDAEVEFFVATGRVKVIE